MSEKNRHRLNMSGEELILAFLHFFFFFSPPFGKTDSCYFGSRQVFRSQCINWNPTALWLNKQVSTTKKLSPKPIKLRWISWNMSIFSCSPLTQCSQAPQRTHTSRKSRVVKKAPAMVEMRWASRWSDTMYSTSEEIIIHDFNLC